MSEPKKINPENPIQPTGIKISEPKTVAAGIPALKTSLGHIYKETNLSESLKVLLDLNQKGGIDCPGCAWPDPDDDRSGLGEYCENGAKAIAEEVSKKKITAAFFKENSVSSLSQLSDYGIGKKGRLTEPMYLPTGSDHYEAITWKEAFAKMSTHLNRLASPNEAIFYTSGRTSNEAAFLYQLFAKAYGTNNLPDCSNMCHESSGVALSETVGIGKGSVKLEDFYQAEIILVIGQNPGTNHPRMLTALEKAKEKGAIIISVNPIKETGLIAFAHPQHLKSFVGGKTTLSDHYLQVKINSDMALFQVINKLLVEKHNEQACLDTEFITAKTEGFESYKTHLASLDLDQLISETGITKDKIELIADLLSRKSKIIACWAMGLTQHKNSVDTIKEVVNLLLLKGSIAKPGAGTCPVRGHSNVQGDRTMGIYEKPSAAFLDKIDSVFNISSPREHGYNTVDSIVAMKEGKAKVFIGMGGNFLSATPDTLYTAEAMQNCDLTVHVSTKLNRSHLIHGKEALILPCLGRTDKDIKNDKEQIVSVENSMGIVHISKGSLTPPSPQLLSEVEIVVQLAMATLLESPIKWSKYLNDYDNIRTDIEQVVPGFTDYNKKVRQPAGFYLPNAAREGSFLKSTKKAKFSIGQFNAVPLKEDEFLMMTVRSHDQFNTTIYGLDDRYRGVYNERRVVFMNKNDMKTLSLKAKSVVNLTSHYDNQERRADSFIVVPYDIPSGCIATYFPEANVLVPINRTAKRSHTPISKSVVIRVEKE
jgi:molybdopterin-dependent oxidoreductase alpha subunit